MYKPTGFLAKQYSVTNETIQKWIKEGKFDKVKKTKGGHYRVWVDESTVTILYARVSSAKQKSSLLKQEQLLKDKYPEATFISDIASGFNQDRRGYKAILESAINGTPQHIVATTSDRITKTGFALIRWIIELSGGRIELLEESDNSEQLDTKTLIAFITSFINSHYGKRSANNNKQENKNLSSK
ncbi:MAG: recombinase family protein [Candidatus Marithrix sp.]